MLFFYYIIIHSSQYRIKDNKLQLSSLTNKHLKNPWVNRGLFNLTIHNQLFNVSLNTKRKSLFETAPHRRTEEYQLSKHIFIFRYKLPKMKNSTDVGDRFALISPTTFIWNYDWVEGHCWMKYFPFHK